MSNDEKLAEMTNVERLEEKMAELKARGCKGFNFTDYSALMSVEPESIEDKAGSLLSMIASMDDPDAWTMRSYTDKETGIDYMEVKCKGENCNNQFKEAADSYNYLTCPECGRRNAM